MLRRTETHYLLNRIFLDDYCVFAQQLEAAELQGLAEQVRQAGRSLGKEEVGLQLPALERLLLEEEGDGGELGRGWGVGWRTGGRSGMVVTCAGLCRGEL